MRFFRQTAHDFVLEGIGRSRDIQKKRVHGIGMGWFKATQDVHGLMPSPILR
jgi:hypothetical protein